MNRSKLALTLMFSLLALAAFPVASATAKKKTTPKVKLFSIKSTTTKVPAPGEKKQMLQTSQLAYAKCGRGYYPLSIGISSADHSFAAQDLGPFGMSAYVDGVGGSAKTKFQALCVKGGRIPSYIGKAVDLGVDQTGSMALVATLKCKSGTVALGAALSHGHAPAIGGYAMYPSSPRNWSYSARIDSYNAGVYKGRYQMLGYPRAACVRATKVSIVEFTGLVNPTIPAEGTAKCKSGRALGWGVRQSAYRSNAGSDGRWAIPLIEKAQFVGKSSMRFRFSRGSDSSGYSAGAPVTAYLICGKLPKG